MLWDGVPILYVYIIFFQFKNSIQTPKLLNKFLFFWPSKHVAYTNVKCNLDTFCLTIISSDLRYKNIFTWICIIFSFQPKLLVYIYFYFNHLIVKSTHFSSFRLLNIYFSVTQRNFIDIISLNSIAIFKNNSTSFLVTYYKNYYFLGLK